MAEQIVQSYALNGLSDISIIAMPEGAWIINFSPYEKIPNEKIPTIWAIVNPDNAKTLRRFQMIPTGFTVPHRGVYVGSATMLRGTDHFPMHFFEVPMPEVENDR